MRPSPLPGRTPRRRALSVTAATAVAAIALLGSGGLSASAAPGDVAIDVYTMNDFHGHLAPGTGEAGAAVISGAYKGFLAANPNSTLVSAGDNVGASPFVSNIQRDEPTIAALNTMGLTVTAIGNHELDKGRDDLAGRISDLADYEHISANLFDKATGEHAFAPYDIQVFDGVKVGFIGAVTEDLPTLVTPSGIATLNVAPIVSSVNAVAATLSDGVDAVGNEEADVLILLIHEGATTATANLTDANSTFGKIVNGTGANFDAIASGHTHLAYSSTVTVGGNTLPVLQTGSFGANLGRISMTVNPTTKELTSITGALVPLVAGSTALYPADPAVATLVANATASANVIGRVSIGSATASLTRAVQSNGTTENRGGESSLGNAVADAQVWATADLGVQVAFMNPGGLRLDIPFASSGADDPDGNITFGEAAAVQPFANTLITQTLTGAQIKTVLEQQWQPASTRPFLKLGINADLTYTYDPSAVQGARVTSITYKGQPLASADTLKIVSNSFLATGGDGFSGIGVGTGKTDTGRVDLDAFVGYVQSVSPVSPDFGTRSIGVRQLAPASTPGAPVALGTVTPESTISFGLTSLVLGGAVVQDTEVVAYFDGVEVSRSPISAAVTDAYDEQGSATVSLTVPEWTRDGAHEVSLVLATTGTTLAYPVTTTGQRAAIVPDAPAAPVLTANGSDTVTATWAPPVFDGASPITGYDVQLRVAGDVVETVSVDADNRSVSFGGLSVGTAYTVTVVAENAVGLSEVSAESNAVTLVAAVVPDPAVTPPATGPAADGSDDLASTGTDVSGPIAAALLLLAAGALLLLRRGRKVAGIEA
jgi:5'-nucleotidase